MFGNGVNDFLGGDGLFPPNAPVDEGTFAGGSARVAHTAGVRWSVTADVLLVAVGRGPVTDGLGLDSTRVQLDRGYVKVNERLQTTAPGV